MICNVLFALIPSSIFESINLLEDVAFDLYVGYVVSITNI